MQKKTAGPLAALAALGLTLVSPALTAGAQAASSDGTWYQATLNPLNHATGSGWLTLKLNGSQATIHEEVSGLAATFMGAAYPHVQHIHINGAGMCPAPSADKNADGVVNTTEGQPAYGAIGTTLSVSGGTTPSDAANVKIAPGGAGFAYDRTITLDSATLSQVKAGNAVIVVHGLDPATLSTKAQGEKSDLVPSLPLAATSPALCGALNVAQLGSIPTGGAQTGDGGSTATDNTTMQVAGATSLALAAGALVLWRRSSVRS